MLRTAINTRVKNATENMRLTDPLLGLSRNFLYQTSSSSIANRQSETENCASSFVPRTYPAILFSASLAALRAAAIAISVPDTGPSESVLAKKTRSIGCRANGCTFVYKPGVDI